MWHHLMRGNAGAIYAIVEELDLTITQMKALHALADCGSEVSVKELGDRLAMSLPGPPAPSMRCCAAAGWSAARTSTTGA